MNFLYIPSSHLHPKGTAVTAAYLIKSRYLFQRQGIGHDQSPPVDSSSVDFACLEIKKNFSP